MRPGAAHNLASLPRSAVDAYGLPRGRDLMSSCVAPNWAGSTVMQVSQRVQRPHDASGMKISGMKMMSGRPPR